LSLAALAAARKPKKGIVTTMRHTNLAVALRLFIFLASISSLVFLGGCAAEVSDPAVANHTTVTPVIPLQANDAFTPAALSSIATPQAEWQTQTLPEAGSPHPTAAVSSPTPLPPTSKPVEPTATSTKVPVKNSPTPHNGFTPDVPTRLVIAAIGLDAPIITVGWSVVEEDGQQLSEWDVPSQRAAGWLNSSALVGARGNTVIVGHQNIDGRVFENLEYLKQGDEIQVQTSSATRKYIVTVRTIVPEKDQPIEVRRENARWIGPSNDERLTLVTCWPRNNNTHRLILVALPAPQS
jgi:sortase A